MLSAYLFVLLGMMAMRALPENKEIVIQVEKILEEYVAEREGFRVLEAWAKKATEELDSAMADWFQNEAPVDWSSDLATLWRGLRVRFRKPQ